MIGSNLKFLSSDILTEFRGRGDEVRVFPLSFAEFLSAFDGEKSDAWREYMMYGGMPRILSCHSDEQKSKYLSDLFQNVYIKDVVNVLASSIGSLTNATKLATTFQSTGIKTNDKTVSAYIAHLLDAFLIQKGMIVENKKPHYNSFITRLSAVNTDRLYLCLQLL